MRGFPLFLLNKGETTTCILVEYLSDIYGMVLTVTKKVTIF
jgi:hypothetical protein